MMDSRQILVRDNLAACALELSKACEPEVLVQLIALRVKGLPHGHVCRKSGSSPLEAPQRP